MRAPKLFDVACGLVLSAVSPAQSNSKKVRASPHAVGVRVSTLIFDCCGDMVRILSPRLRRMFCVDPSVVPFSGMVFNCPVVPALVVAELPFGLPPLIQYV